AGVEVVSVQGLADLVRGKSRAEVLLRGMGEQANQVEVSWFARGPEGHVHVAAREVQLAPGRKTPVSLVLRLDRRGAYTTWLEITDSGGARYTSVPAQARIPDRYEALLLRPAYRQSLYAALPRHELRVQLTPYPFDEDFTGAVLKTVFVQKGKVLLSHTCGAPQAAGKPWVMSVDLSAVELAPGPARLRLAVERRGKRLWTKSWQIKVVPPHTPQVALGPELETYVNGEPFFPIGLYHAPVEAFDRARALGFNCVQVWGNTVESARKSLDAVEAHGLKALLEMSGLLRGKYRAEDFRAVVRACRDHPALLAWYPVDEPAETMYEACLDAYRICREEDPHHPVYLVMCRPDAFARFVATTDVLAVDPYPIPSAPVGLVASWCRRAADAVGERQAFWLIPQLQNLAAYRGDPSKGRGPTPQEEWCMVFQGLIYGAKGIIYYPWDDGKCGLVHEPALMKELPRINAFLAKWGQPIAASRRTLLSGLGKSEPREGTPELHAALFTGERGCLLLATNTGKQPRQLTVKLAEHGGVRGVVRSVLDGRSWKIEGGTVSIRLDPLEVVAAEIVRK
ncbi:MAG: hypothetical protein J7M26_05675, partial [Armatimonadetes bacterium]|nr:hypothetical protein [Armatimonadota bacterium]